MITAGQIGTHFQVNFLRHSGSAHLVAFSTGFQWLWFRVDESARIRISPTVNEPQHVLLHVPGSILEQSVGVVTSYQDY